MKKKFKFVLFAVLASLTAFCSVLTSCSDDDLMASSETSSANTVDFVATFTDRQQQMLSETGYPYEEIEQKNSWNNVISSTIPATWGLFDDPRTKTETRAVGIYGSYPAQYWSMLRVKFSEIPNDIKEVAVDAIDEIESKTNVRFYNSIKDLEYYEPGHIKLPNIAVRMDGTAVEGSGSYGLVGGEQFINVPTALKQANYDEIKRFFMHAFCNAAGMFNEQQRKDRDDYVVVNLNNVKDNCKSAFAKITQNYTMQGAFDMSSITLAASKDYSKNGENTIMKKGNYSIATNSTLSAGDIYFLNSYYLPYKARTDNYVELDDTYYPNGQKLTESERLELQSQINAQRGLYGIPPIENRKVLVEW